ncbi:MAG TPA: hypothetical protein VGM23_00125 [Armatimonadota bacterium]|jgi:hypothetical protein
MRSLHFLVPLLLGLWLFLPVRLLQGTAIDPLLWRNIPTGW